MDEVLDLFNRVKKFIKHVWDRILKWYKKFTRNVKNIVYKICNKKNVYVYRNTKSKRIRKKYWKLLINEFRIKINNKDNNKLVQNII